MRKQKDFSIFTVKEFKHSLVKCKLVTGSITLDEDVILQSGSKLFFFKGFQLISKGKRPGGEYSFLAKSIEKVKL